MSTCGSSSDVQYAVWHVSFEGGILLIEIVDVWETERGLAFSIRAETAQIPNTTLDEHVRVGGQFFDVLRGEYRLEELPDGISVDRCDHV
jgi:hypothetical protein